MQYDTLIQNALVLDGTGGGVFRANVAIASGKIAAVAPHLEASANHTVDAEGLCLAPGFIDVHTHDDLNVIHNPHMLEKISQGVTTVIVGNCGISASPVTLAGDPPDPLSLLGDNAQFQYPHFANYVSAVQAAQPSVNVGALVGHTAIRNNHMARLDRAATDAELAAMTGQLQEALQDGALGMSSGLAYASAKQSTTDEVLAMVKILGEAGAVYTTHLRTEFDGVLEAMNEAFYTSHTGKAPLIISHLKCAGKGNWGRSTELLQHLEGAARTQKVACDCYPYAASSSTLDLAQVTEDTDIFITWSEPHPEHAGKMLGTIAAEWQVSLLQAAERLQPAGAVYYCMSEQDVENILRYPRTMVGSDGLPNDPHPHPRLWGAFPRVLAHYCRERKIFDLATAIHKMTGLSAAEFRLPHRGEIRAGYWADLVLFDAEKIQDTATFANPKQVATGIQSVWVNGELSYVPGQYKTGRNGQFLSRCQS
ncbi:D-aminoacylase [Gilvimarinus agarilyticus]|uniref:N-acyl-D-amino-acid deacylase family protein n=1 Tax=Gilvimarinus sp. 2_MG-2023 TaxID=3062666 RepID=UPI001C09B3D7|nr:D-aminoacylase [Gilvimarinus sp. 2_MG-2023]MBU2884511.1 D-aminoacylase [Gilvimarinus agarilyticus]MDO6569640.1 D-aminoacylase [Gilvimarinus sp. 2_MG-2023]